MRKPGAAVLTTLLALAALPAVGAPEYRCHPERVGHGTVSDHLAARLRETANLEGEAARAEHEALRDFTSATSLAGGIVRARLAGHYLRAGRADEALEAALRAAANRYVQGRLVDDMRALAAQIHASREQWDRVVNLLQPIIDRECRPPKPATRYLLALAHARHGDHDLALGEIDAACPRDETDAHRWVEMALRIDCAANGATACARRLLDYARLPEPTPELLRLLNHGLSGLAGYPDARPLLARAEAAGVIDAQHRVMPQPRRETAPLRVIERAPPDYPLEALHRGFGGGYTLVEIAVAAEGTVTATRILDESPPGLFGAASREAALRHRYLPRRVDGEAVPAITRTRFRFHVHRDGVPAPTAPPEIGSAPSIDSRLPTRTPAEPPGLSTACIESPDTPAP